MREDDYTGFLIDEDDDEQFLAADADLYEFDVDDEFFDPLESPTDQVLHFGEVVNGIKTLRAVAERLHDFADELYLLADDGWELVDDVSNGHATIVNFIEIGDEQE